MSDTQILRVDLHMRLYKAAAKGFSSPCRIHEPQRIILAILRCFFCFFLRNTLPGMICGRLETQATDDYCHEVLYEYEKATFRQIFQDVEVTTTTACTSTGYHRLLISYIAASTMSSFVGLSSLVFVSGRVFCKPKHGTSSAGVDRCSLACLETLKATSNRNLGRVGSFFCVSWAAEDFGDVHTSLKWCPFFFFLFRS